MSLSPARAWQPYRPDDKNPWDIKKVGHLYRRAAFGANYRQLDEGVADGPEKTIAALLSGGPALEAFNRPDGGDDLVAQSGERRRAAGVVDLSHLAKPVSAARAADALLAQSFRHQQCQGSESALHARAERVDTPQRSRQLPHDAVGNVERPGDDDLARHLAE